MANTFFNTWFPSSLRGKAVFNVQGYGAKGDGVHDDSDNIQQAIFAAIRAGGGVVYFPAVARTSFSSGQGYIVTKQIQSYVKPTSTAKSPAGNYHRITVPASFTNVFQTGDICNLSMYGAIFATGQYAITVIDSTHIDVPALAWTYPINAVTNNGAGLIRIQVGPNSPFIGEQTNRDSVKIATCPGVPNAVGTWLIDVPIFISGNYVIDLLGSTFAGTYTGGGTVEPPTSPFTPTGKPFDNADPFITSFDLMGVELVGDRSGSGGGSASLIVSNFAGFVFNENCVDSALLGADGIYMIGLHASGGCIYSLAEQQYGFHLRHCQFKNAGPIAVVCDTGSSTVSECNFQGSANVGVGLYMAQGTCSSCNFQGWAEGVRCGNGAGLSIQGSRFEVNTIGVNVGLDQHGNGIPQSDLRICDNQFERDDTAIYIQQGRYVTILNNGVSGSVNIAGTTGPPYGLRIAGGNKIFVAGNAFVNAASVACIDVGNASNAYITFINNELQIVANLTGAGVQWITPTANKSTFLFINNDPDPTFGLVYADLPAASTATGRYFAITNGHGAAGAWAETITGAGGILVGNCLVFSNGTNWTLAGK